MASETLPLCKAARADAPARWASFAAAVRWTSLRASNSEPTAFAASRASEFGSRKASSAAAVLLPKIAARS